MSAEPIISRVVIAEQAYSAALQWVSRPESPKPTNPYDAFLQPSHFHEWRIAFERFLLLHSTGEVSA